MMTDRNDKAGAGARQDRLKSALRENLKRRKEQVRERGRAAVPSRDVEVSRDEDEEIAGKTGE